MDIDATLLNSSEEITEEINTAIQADKTKGVKVVLCTGRPIGGVYSFIEELKLNDEEDFVITFNGALVQNTRTKEVTTKNFLTNKDLKSLFELSQKVNSRSEEHTSELQSRG